MAWVKISGLMVAGYTAGEAVHKWNTDEVADDEFRFRIAPSTNPLACLAKKCRPWTPPTP
jgi:hypothetical protein